MDQGTRRNTRKSNTKLSTPGYSARLLTQLGTLVFGCLGYQDPAGIRYRGKRGYLPSLASLDTNYLATRATLFRTMHAP